MMKDLFDRGLTLLGIIGFFVGLPLAVGAFVALGVVAASWVLRLFGVPLT